MTVLPVVERELRVASRRGLTYWGRAGAALIAVVVSSWILVLQSAVPFGQMGKAMFTTLSFLSFLFAAFAGVTYSSDSVSVEKREGTLGLLFLTDLRGHDVTLGKLAASSLGAVYSLLASLPVLALALLMGGVTGGEYWRMVLVLMNLLLLSLTLGLLMSVLNSDSKRAAVAAFFAVLAALFLFPALGGLAGLALRRFGYSDDVITAWSRLTVFWMTPVIGYSNVFDLEYKTHAGDFWRSQGYTAGVALLCLAHASRRLPRSWQEGAVEPVRRGFRARLERLRFPTLGHRGAFRTRLLELSPIAWLSGRHWLRNWTVWGFLGVYAAIFLLLAWQTGSDWWNGGTYMATSILLHLALKVWVANEAPRQFVDDRGSGAMELLLSTPLSVPEILHGRFVALRRQFAGPIITVLVVDALFLLGSMMKDMGNHDDLNAWVLLWLLRMFFLGFDSFTLAWLGLWTGMASSGSRPGSGAVTRVLVLPSVICLVLLTLMVLPWLHLAGDNFSMLLGLSAWALIGAGTNVFWLMRVRGRLPAQFRDLATQRTGKKRGWFRRGAAAGAA